MAGQWEPVAGVFWSSPPEPSVEGISVYWFIFSALVVAIVGAVVVWRNAEKVEPLKWSLRDHLGKVGAAVTYTYLVVIVAMIWGRTGTLLTMPLNEVGDFLAGAFGPVAFLWLVLGFLQQGDELRQGTKALQMQGDELRLSTEALRMQADELRKSVEQQSIMAVAATQQIEAQREVLQLQLDEIERSNRANFVFGYGSLSSGGRPGTPVETSIEIGCSAANAHDVRVVFDPPVGDRTYAEFELVTGQVRSKVPLKFTHPSEDVSGVITLSYTGADALEREEKFVYSIRVAEPWVKIKNRLAN